MRKLSVPIDVGETLAATVWFPNGFYLDAKVVVPHAWVGLTFTQKQCGRQSTLLRSKYVFGVMDMDVEIYKAYAHCYLLNSSRLLDEHQRHADGTDERTDVRLIPPQGAGDVRGNNVHW